MTVNFYLINRPDKNGECRINLHFRYEGNEFIQNTLEKVKKKHWNKKQYVNIGDSESANKNATLTRFEDKIKEAYNYIRSKGIKPNNENLYEKFNELVNYVEVKPMSFYDYFNDFLELKKPPLLSQETYNIYITLIKHLKDFENFAKYEIKFNTLTDLFYAKFYEYMQKKDKPTNDNTFAKYIKKLNCNSPKNT